MRAAILGLLLAGCGGLDELPATVPSTSDDSTPGTTSAPETEPTTPTTSTPGSSPTSEPGPGTGTWSHTITVDGVTTEWWPEEVFATSSGAGTVTRITWDALNVYVAVQHPDVAGGASHWLVLTVGTGAPGARSGVPHGTQQPDLVFDATHVVRRKADGSYDALLAWNGASWDETPGWLSTVGRVGEDEASQSIELALPRAVLGLGDVVDLHVNWVFEGVGSESSYASTPSISFVDGYDPDYGAFYRFDLVGETAPADHAPLVTAPTTSTVTAPPSDTAAPADTGGVPSTATDTGSAPPWRRTRTVDGDLSDWTADERFDTSQGPGTDTYVSWDDDTLFVGVRHPDVTTGGPSHWVVATLGNGVGTAPVGPMIGTQQPGLPFGGALAARWKADGSYADVLAWDGVAWVPSAVSVTFAEDDAAGTLELGVPLAAGGFADTVELHVNWVFEGAGFESSFGVTPSGSFAQGAYDPDYGAWYEFDRSSAAAPADYAPSP